jgi:DNA-binding transcriptional regulator LsrR (DeoR family)
MAQLQDLFQTHAIVKVLDFLTLYKEFEYTRTDIANETGISRRTLYQIWPSIERFELVKVTKSSGMIKFYKLNTDNPISKQLVALADQISIFQAERIIGEESSPILKTELPIPSPQGSYFLTITEKTITHVRTVEVKSSPTSEIEETLQKRLDLKNGEVKIPFLSSTGLVAGARRKNEQSASS